MDRRGGCDLEKRRTTSGTNQPFIAREAAGRPSGKICVLYGSKKALI
jgi:hypothetical protein